MPEIAEIRIMGDFINETAGGRIFSGIRKSRVSKVKTSLKVPYDYFSVKAETRGKELKIIFTSKEGKEKSMMLGMGMSGNWTFCETGQEPKHMHLMLDTIDGMTLGLVDVRRFAKWKWGDWNLDRGPDPSTDSKAFRKNITSNLPKRIFSKPICEVLLDQKYFNGIGNYLRAEILFKAKQDPFEVARDALTKNVKILDMCERLPLEAYQLGGGQLKDWENPYVVEEKSFSRWILCYSNPAMCKLVDKTGRTIWYDPKYKRKEKDTDT